MRLLLAFWKSGSDSGMGPMTLLENWMSRIISSWLLMLGRLQEKGKCWGLG